MTMTIAGSRSLSVREEEILTLGLDRLRGFLPPDWRVDQQPEPQGSGNQGDRGLDALVSVRDPQEIGTTLVVQVKRRFAPRDVEGVAGGRVAVTRSLSPGSTFMVVAPWLSRRTRALLAEQGIGYLDLTGNALLRVSRPAVMIRTTGADEDPDPPRREGTSLRGVAAGRVVRLLADVKPPYTATAMARAAGVSIAQVSRLLAALDREALVERGARGRVDGADWAGLLRRRAEHYQLFRSNRSQGYVSSRGPRDVLDRLAEAPGLYRALTGSFAAAERAPIAAPSLLTAYVDDMEPVAQALGLLPADRGADVVLLRPHDMVVLERTEQVDGMAVVAPSQLALDCLGGNGRMPAEGEALLNWMAEHEAEWRRPSLESL
jgi:DNA-binding transcriptional ArsR family regulator